ncbi:hypothetical protein PBCV1_a251bL [Paramecium bursaria Chlorella virus 1]|uniref:Uncharacterized protein n=1 Tax=Paramecium bursaria Chlorella virus 1 TaxID=10506 RepID=F8TU06_PBCV1|nr:hypothetical protein PBCV1_a251bL [Paramecium bursaria Chlorella virus 1]AEI70067.1 hypothetical protein [Paramecium bursaria Chlorella virus 1]
MFPVFIFLPVEPSTLTKRPVTGFNIFCVIIVQYIQRKDILQHHFPLRKFVL